MAYSAKSGADDDYDTYKQVFNDETAEAAEPYFQDAEDGDAAAQTRLIIGGLFFGLFALQQWVLEDPAEGSADAGTGAGTYGSGNRTQRMLAEIPPWIPQIEAGANGSVRVQLLHFGD